MFDAFRETQLMKERSERIGEIDEVKEAVWRIKGAIRHKDENEARNFLENYKIPYWKHHVGDRERLLAIIQKFLSNKISDEDNEMLECLQEVLENEYMLYNS